ncbi:DUF3429 domain-containing protein [Aureimonas flava]|uniref:DUF3429 domain-containing protein n=1 Tax=Aureimonas flava TaxID=2320271 RepID=A0A3A1WFR7_9HYPH|nr:DUF3429 domain-containing protein [Aureimonas flava]RIX98776.1 DUF3429 domain-containing protein [Aureimonas flava]
MYDDASSAPPRSRAEQMVRAAWILGLGGLIPFVVGAWMIVTGSEVIPLPDLPFVVLSYGAIILSFLGGIRWGAALNEPGRQSPTALAQSVIPAVGAWVCVLLPSPWSFVGLAVAFVLQGLWDVAAIRAGRIATPWFAPLRVVLTVGAVLSLAVIAYASAQPVAY